EGQGTRDGQNVDFVAGGRLRTAEVSRHLSRQSATADRGEDRGKEGGRDADGARRSRDRHHGSAQEEPGGETQAGSYRGCCVRARSRTCGDSRAQEAGDSQDKSGLVPGQSVFCQYTPVQSMVRIASRMLCASRKSWTAARQLGSAP